MERYKSFISPKELKETIKISKKALDNVIKGRKEIKDILDNKDNRKMIIVGPCSIHDFDETLIYANSLLKLQEKVKDKFLILMRVYLEKPRTSIGWKGFINDPYLDDSNNILEGLKKSRELLIKINELGIPCASEFLEVLVWPYIEDLISWGAIGARTSESQVHREFCSGLETPIGFKNATSGDIESSINSIISAKTHHDFIGINEEGIVSIITTHGNPYCNIVLRGGITGPNYESEFVKEIEQRLEEHNLSKNIFIDCSHGNSKKDYQKQAMVFKDVIEQISQGNSSIKGIMLESYIKEGNQKIPFDKKDLKPGVSITDACISFDETEKLVMGAYEKISF